MSYNWTFSPKSQFLLQRCLNAAAPPDDSNKWYKSFGSHNLDLLETENNIITIEDSPEVDSTHLNQSSQGLDIPMSLEDFLDPDSDVITNFIEVKEKLKHNTKFLTELAQALPLNTSYQLILHVFNYSDNSDEFKRSFAKYFIPAYIKRDNSRVCVDLLTKSQETCPHLITIILKEMMKDYKDIQNNIISDFILSLNNDNQTYVLESVLGFDFTSEEFSHNLHNIYTAYKNCNKTDIIQQGILHILKMHSQFCSADKNYGKLFLSFLHEEKNLKRKIDISVIRKVLEVHNSPFRRPCFAVINDLNES